VDAVERLTLEEARSPSLIALTHVHRYELAAELCAGKRVLDLCCGSGYGSRILAGAAASVTGIDADLDSIEAAREAFAGRSGLEFEHADAYEVLDRGLASDFDAIVLLEALEHLEDPERALERLEAHADAGMLLVLSIPNSRRFGEDNPHHRVEFEYESAMAAFDRFADARVLYQFHAEGSMIGGGGDAIGEGRVTLPERAEPETANHFIGIVNPEPGVDADRWSNRLQAVAAPTFNSYMLQLERANRRLWRTNQQLARDRLGVADSGAASALRGKGPDEYPEWLEPVAAGGERVFRGAMKVLLTILPHGLTLIALRIRDRLRQDRRA
jgi:SAM-dependent methyltransferase